MSHPTDPKKSITADIERERLLSLINSMADGVAATDQRGDVVLYNGAMLNILDVNADLTGRRLDEVAEIIDKNGQRINLTDMITSAKTGITSRDYLISYSDSSRSNLYISIAPVHLGFGKSGNQGFVVLLRDITHEKSLEEERDEFISVVSHELRTPIAIAEGNISNAQFIVEKNNAGKTITETLKVAHDQVVFLSEMINDLSTLSRAEQGVLKVDSEPINVYNLLNDLQRAYKPDADAKKLKLLIKTDPKLETLRSSLLYLHEILQNFITNAIKYTSEGSVTVSAKQEVKGVKFEVSDTGIGIGKTDQERVFDKFFRSEDFRTRDHNGTGLGLYVTIKLAKLINAKVTLESELNKGSVFSIFVPNYK